jgi:hypothetical protein
MPRRHGLGGAASFGGERRFIQCLPDNSISSPRLAAARITPPHRRSVGPVRLRKSWTMRPHRCDPACLTRRLP